METEHQGMGHNTVIHSIDHCRRRSLVHRHQCSLFSVHFVMSHSIYARRVHHQANTHKCGLIMLTGTCARVMMSKFSNILPCDQAIRIRIRHLILTSLL